MFLLLLHGEDQHSAHRQRQQTDEILRNGELPELGDLVVTGAHDHGGHTVNGQEVSAPAGDHDSGSGCGGVQTQIDAGGNGHGSKDVHGADGGTGQGCQQAGQDAESEDQHEGVDIGASILATVSPTRLVRPVLPRASAMPMTPADIRMMGALMELRISLKSITPEIRMTPTARPVMA